MMTQPHDDEIRELGVVAFRVAFRLLGSSEDAEDIAQEAVTRAAIRWNRVHQYAPAFVGRVSTNLALGVLRKRRTLPAGEAESPGGITQLADRMDLVAALARLSARQREVIVLRYIADYSERDIAETLGCSTGAVKQHGSRGLIALRRALPHDTCIEGAWDGK